MKPKYKTIPAGQFKAQCLSLMDEVKKSGASLTITKHGKPVAKLVPATSEVQPLFGYMKQHGSVKILGDITEPIDVDWEAQA